VTDQTNRPDPTTGPTPTPTSPGATPLRTSDTEPAVAPEPTATPTEAAAAPPAWASTGEASNPSRRRWVWVAAIVGALVVVGGIGFSAGATMPDDDEPSTGIHRMRLGDQDRDQMPHRGQFPGMFPGQGGGSGGFRHGDRSNGRRGPGGPMPGDGQFPGWQMPNGGMPGGGWMRPHDGRVPNATQAPGATPAPSTSPAP